jgi:hypothetical protein
MQTARLLREVGPFQHSRQWPEADSRPIRLSEETIVGEKLNLQIIVLGKILQEIVGKRLYIVNARIHKHSLVPAQIAGWADIGRIGHAVVSTEG